MYSHFAGWNSDCAAPSGMLFAFPRSRCVTFTFAPSGKDGWSPADEESLAGFRARADFDELAACPTPKPRRREAEHHDVRAKAPALRPRRDAPLYAVAWLDARNHRIDRLKLMRVDAAAACP